MNKFSRKFFLSLLFLLQSYYLWSQTDTINISNLNSGIEFDKTWKFSRGDDIGRSSVTFDDSDWKYLSGEKDEDLTDPEVYHGISWYRTSFIIDSLLDGTPLALKMHVFGAADIFIDGKLIQSIGIVGHSTSEEVSGFTARPTFVPLPFNNKGKHTIALRCSNFSMSMKLRLLNVRDKGGKNFELKLISMRKSLNDLQDVTEQTIPVFFAGVFIVLSLFHFILFLYYRRNRSNLYYSLFTFFMFAIFFAIYATLSGADFQMTKHLIEVTMVSAYLAPLFFMGILYDVFYNRLPKQFWILSAILTIGFSAIFIFNGKGIGLTLLVIYSIAAFIESIRIIIRAVIKKRDGAWVFVFGLLFPIIGTLSLTFISYLLEKFGFTSLADKISDYILEVLGYGFLMSVSISMTIYLGRDFAKMNKKLREQIIEIRTLFERTIDQEKEKKNILENQKEDLEKMVVLRTEEVVRQKAVIELKNKDILDNLLYAKRIQDAILPEIRLIYQALRESFIIYWPKDIVSGDFYSFSQKDGKVIIAAADCTGHGVTGAFMSMIGSSVLNQIVNERGITTPSQILNNLNNGIAEALKQTENDVNDGMDICVCTFDLNANVLQYAGANRPLWLIRNDKFEIIKSDKSAIGGFHLSGEVGYTNHEIKLQRGDCIYLTTDGFADQFGGPQGKKLLSKRFRETLFNINSLPMNEQEIALTKFFNEWKGDEIQVDDILVIGIRI